jgi:hypothetical protein
MKRSEEAPAQGNENGNENGSENCSNLIILKMPTFNTN